MFLVVMMGVVVVVVLVQTVRAQGSKSSLCDRNLNYSPFDLVNLGTRVSGKG